MVDYSSVRSLLLGLFAGFITYQGLNLYRNLGDVWLNFQSTCAIIKPNAVAKGNVGAILQRIDDEGYQIILKKQGTLSQEMAAKFYEEHETQPFFQDLVDFMSSGPSVVLELQKKNSVSEWRKLIGPTDPAEARKVEINSLRALFGDDVTKNGFHGSATAEDAARELGLLLGSAGRKLKSVDRRYHNLEVQRKLQEQDKETVAKSTAEPEIPTAKGEL
ncbi:hypothetical protein SARC_02840 [Sphaeroforma arctica JP610]|uniref:Nucleoside diphosphate kinase-like domain-containing protein n=1 Tax=Sphaeroforma arctica JP610 TaxID=667725 RepID=A0A0L0G7Q1_9EUKA|nr:hypothetical protein SARC_02840 [Sphaeroforma arctica JP610]KNC84949.1 hypothetical protein SARC_02840 [Sphaeroforma arctica JP610]|eukprot:XP_014158851.1 hypothetical protein SARC_02840 [Sphaeroforma arctica JP610]